MREDSLWVQKSERVRIRFHFLAALVLLLSLSINLLSASATEPKKPEWLASCPAIVDVSPTSPTPKTQNLIFQNSGQLFKLLKRGTTDFVSEPASVIGCYIVQESITNENQSPPWQIGALNRDSSGYYFINAAGRSWRLTLNSAGTIFEIQPGSTYYKNPGMGFKIDTAVPLPQDCKMQDFRLGAIRLGFPRDETRVPATGTTKNLIIVLDYPDAPFTGDLTQSVNNVLAPALTTEFFALNSYNKLNLIFDVHPKVVRINSSEKSFAPNSSGGFFVNGVQQDHRLIKEALAVANTQANLAGYQSINFFAPTGDSLKYYGSAFLGLQLTAGSSTVINSQLVSGLIGTITSSPPSWKVFAHEYGHLLGMYDLYVQGDGNTGKSPGPFDLMGNTTSTASSFFGFNRWVQGWLADSDVICQLGEVTKTDFTLTKVNATSGQRVYVRPLSGTKALVIEHRSDSKFDQLGVNTGLVVYTIDFTVGSLQGAVSIQHSEGDRPATFNSDVERYQAATLTQGQYLTVSGISIYADTITNEQASFKVMTPTELTSLLAEKTKPVITPTTPTKSKKTITCIKGTNQLKVKALKPKCPTGYRKK